MLTGTQFKLKTPTLASHIVDGKREGVTVPAGAIIKVISGPTGGDRVVDVLWEGRMFVMFAVDLSECGIEITDRGVTA